MTKNTNGQIKTSSKEKFKQWTKEFFGNNFLGRFALWSFGFTIFTFGLAFFIMSNIGYATYDTLFMPVRILVGVSDVRNYGTYILIPAGIFFTLMTFVFHYIRTKKWRIDYLLAIVPIVFAGFVLDAVLKIGYISKTLEATIKSKFPLAERPIVILWILLAIPCFAIGIGLTTGTHLMPNTFAIMVHETSCWLKWSYRKTQWLYDSGFIALGFLISIINIYTNKVDGTNPINWMSTLHYIGIATILVLLTQGFLIQHSITWSEKLFYK